MHTPHLQNIWLYSHSRVDHLSCLHYKMRTWGLRWYTKLWCRVCHTKYDCHTHLNCQAGSWNFALVLTFLNTIAQKLYPSFYIILFLLYSSPWSLLPWPWLFHPIHMPCLSVLPTNCIQPMLQSTWWHTHCRNQNICASRILVFSPFF